MQRLRKDVDGIIVDQIVKYLLFQTLDQVSNSNSSILILSSDNTIDLNSYDVSILYDKGNSLNRAIIKGIQNQDCDSFMLVMPDLPGITSQLLEKVLHLNKIFPYVIVPTHDMGTAIAILPKEVYELEVLGPDSAQRIIEYCDSKGLELGILETELSSHDLDTLEDLKYWFESLRKKVPKINEITLINK